jgi:NDP-sugar pyrophosphorylase family protein
MHDADLFVMAAGLGTRLRPLTESLPKPLVPVCGIPLLAWALATGRRHGARRAVVNAHWCAERLLQWTGVAEGLEVEVVAEPEILGTGGGLRNARDRLAPRFTVVNGDVLSAFPLDRLQRALPSGGAALGLRAAPDDARRYGPVLTDADGSVVGLRQYRSPPVGPTADDAHFTGLYALDRVALDGLEDGFSDIAATVFPALMERRALAAVRSDALWYDIGDPAAYLHTNLAVLRGASGLAFDPMERAAWASRNGVGWGSGGGTTRVAGSVWVGHGAVVDGLARLEDVVVGPGARIGPVHLTRTVVWEGVAVDRDLDGAVAWHPDRDPLVPVGSVT